MFDYEAFADEMYKQSKELIPADFSEKDKKYISTTISNFVKLAGENLNNDKENNFSDEQKVFITQVIAEWTFHKSVDLIRAEIPNEYWDAVMQKIAFTIFEVIKQALLKNIPQGQVLKAVEHHVKDAYKMCIKGLPIDDKQKKIASKYSNIDECTKAMNIDKLKDVVKKILYIIMLFTIGFTSSVMVHAIFRIAKRYTNSPIISVVIGLSIIIIACALYYFIKQKLYIKKQIKQLEDVRQQMQDLVNPDKMYERLGVDVITLQVGQNLLCIADPDQDGLLLAKLAALRQRLTDKLGYIIPNARIIDSYELKENEYSISIRNNVVDKGVVYPDKYMIIADNWNNTGKELPNDVIEAEDPIYKVKAYWVNEDIAKEANDITVVASDDVIIQHVEEVLVQKVDTVLSELDTKKYIDSVKKNCHGSDEKLLNNLSYGDIRRIFVNLIQEKVSIKDIVLILSRLEDYSRFHKESDILSERLRKDLSRQISLTHCNDDKKIYAIDLSTELTNKLLTSVELQKEYNKTKLSLDKQIEHDLIEDVSIKLMETHKQIGTQPVLLCDDKLRLGLYRLLVRHISTIVVLTKSEIESDIKLEIVDTIRC